MKNYKYMARDMAGNSKQGMTQAGSANDVLDWLRDQGFIPIAVDEIEQAQPEQPQTSGRKKRIKSADLSATCWQLTTMVEGGIPITDALDIISEDIENLRLRSVLMQVVDAMRTGVPFSEAVAAFPKVFNNLAYAMILAGETGGALPTTLRKLAEYYDNKDKLAKKVKGAMAYPIFVVTFILLIVIFIMTFIIPRFRVIFDQIGGDLPLFTKIFMTFYDTVKDNVLYIIGGTIVIVVGTAIFRKTRQGHFFLSRMMLKIPLIGSILSQAFIAMFCRTMSTLLTAGVSVLEVFDILSEMTSNDVIKNAITNTRDRIVSGSSVSASMAAATFFPNMAVKMMQVGEETGSLSEVLDRTADFYERKVDATITTVMGLLEPIMIVMVGGIVLIVVVALYLPIFSISDVKQ